MLYTGHFESPLESKYSFIAFYISQCRFAGTQYNKIGFSQVKLSNLISGYNAIFPSRDWRLPSPYPVGTG